MRCLVVVGVLSVIAPLAAPALADVLYEQVVRTSDSLVRGTVELEDRVTVSLRGDRWRQEIEGARSVTTRRGARYSKPGHRVTLDQADRAVRYEIDLDAGTYAAEPFAEIVRAQEAALGAAERALGVDPAGPPPAVEVSVSRTGERLTVHGRECERVILRARKDVIPAATRGAGPAAATPVRFADTFNLCLAPETAETREARALEMRIAGLTGERGALLDRQLRVFDARRDILAIFELLNRVLEREQERVGGFPLRWERVFTGPRRDQPEAVLYRHSGEVTRLESGALDPSGFELPAGLVLDPRRGSPAP